MMIFANDQGIFMSFLIKFSREKGVDIGIAASTYTLSFLDQIISTSFKY